MARRPFNTPKPDDLPPDAITDPADPTGPHGPGSEPSPESEADEEDESDGRPRPQGASPHERSRRVGRDTGRLKRRELTVR
jgi:hypothetical protein